MLAITKSHNPITRLTCCCCGVRTMGRQWHNRDTGYGLCQSCADWIKEKNTPEEMRRIYGTEGYHYPDQRGEIRL